MRGSVKDTERHKSRSNKWSHVPIGRPLLAGGRMPVGCGVVTPTRRASLPERAKHALCVRDVVFFLGGGEDTLLCCGGATRDRGAALNELLYSSLLHRSSLAPSILVSSATTAPSLVGCTREADDAARIVASVAWRWQPLADRLAATAADRSAGGDGGWPTVWRRRWLVSRPADTADGTEGSQPIGGALGEYKVEGGGVSLSRTQLWK